MTKPNTRHSHATAAVCAGPNTGFFEDGTPAKAAEPFDALKLCYPRRPSKGEQGAGADKAAGLNHHRSEHRVAATLVFFA